MAPRPSLALAAALLAVSAAAAAAAAAAAPALGPNQQPQCNWAGAFCDLSSAFFISRLPEFVGPDPAALNATMAALLRAAGRDATCGALTTQEACDAPAVKDDCEWYSAETLPSCIARGAVEQEMASVIACPGSLIEAEVRCRPFVSAERCNKAKGCAWSTAQTNCHAAKLLEMTDTAAKVAEFQRKFNARDPEIVGSCPQLANLLKFQEVCPLGANYDRCPAPDCAFDGTSCIHTSTFFMKLGGVDPFSKAFATARQCNAALTRDACAAVGSPVTVAPAVLAAAKAGDFKAGLAAAGVKPAAPHDAHAAAAKSAAAAAAAAPLATAAAGAVALAAALL